MTQLAYTKDDFTQEQWDVLCWARRKRDATVWYRALRTYTRYTGHPRTRKNMEVIVDAWLDRHPTWTGRYIDRKWCLEVLNGTIVHAP